MALNPNTKVYETKTIGTAKFWIQEGYYTIEQLEQITQQLKMAKAAQDNHLRKAMGNPSQAPD